MRRLVLTAAMTAAVFVARSPSAAAQDAPIRGFVDLHNHQFSNLGFGGLVLWGAPFHPNGEAAALPNCDYTWLYSPVSFIGTPSVPLPGYGYPVHGAWGTGDLIGMALDQGFGHGVDGHPTYGWPRWNSVTHQQVYVDWLKRAVDGGLRLMVMLAVNNEIFCQLSNRRAGFGCDDMPSVDRQLQGAKDLEAYVDALHGGPGQGWYRIAYGPQHARQIMSEGKLAVVLGIEVDTLFGCRKAGGCTDADVKDRMAAYHAQGVRHVFPVHLFDNGFGGAALYNPAFNAGNKVMNGDWFTAYDCSGAGYGFQIGDSNPLFDTLNVLTGGLAPPAYPAATCNARGLTPLGDGLVRRMMSRKMILDVDHMSAVTADAVLSIAEAEDYPVVAGHTGFLDTSVGPKRSEGQKSSAEVERIRALGGVVAPILHQGNKSELAPHATATSAVPNDCSNSSKTWAQAYLYAVDRMNGGAVGIGSDFNGFAGMPGPRFGPEACHGDDPQVPQGGGVTYPFTALATGAVLDRHVIGSRTFDYNVDGLAHVGLLPDFIEDLRRVGVSDQDLEPLFRSAEAYVAMWERIEATSHFPPDLTVTAAPAPNAAGWNRTNVAVTAAATESAHGWPVVHLSYETSGADAVGRTDAPANPFSLPLAAEGITTARFTALDEAGNATPEHAIAVRIDRTAPAVSCAAYDGAWHAEDVVLPCTATDPVSGLASPADASFALSTSVPDGVETSTASTNSRVVRDVADNAFTSGPVANVKVDRKDPTITLTSPGPDTFVVNQPVTAAYACADGGSGVATCAGTVPAGAAVPTGAAGTHAFRVDAADAVGNASAASVTYRVTYAICPLYDDTKAKHRGATFPIKVRLCDAAGANLSSAAVTLTATGIVRRSDLATGAVEDAGQANPDGGFRYDAALGGYVYNLSTAPLASGTWGLRFTASGDPEPHEVLLQVK